MRGQTAAEVWEDTLRGPKFKEAYPKPLQGFSLGTLQPRSREFLFQS